MLLTCVQLVLYTTVHLSYSWACAWQASVWSVSWADGKNPQLLMPPRQCCHKKIPCSKFFHKLRIEKLTWRWQQSILAQLKGKNRKQDTSIVLHNLITQTITENAAASNVEVSVNSSKLFGSFSLWWRRRIVSRFPIRQKQSYYFPWKPQLATLKFRASSTFNFTWILEGGAPWPRKEA